MGQVSRLLNPVMDDSDLVTRNTVVFLNYLSGVLAYRDDLVGLLHSAPLDFENTSPVTGALAVVLGGVNMEHERLSSKFP